MIADGLREGALFRGTVATVLIASVLHARIDDQVQEVDRQIDEDVESRDEQQRPLDHWIVPAQDGGYDEVPDTGQAEDRFGHDRAADQQCERETEYGDHRYQRIAQRVVEDDVAFGQSFGTRGADVILAEDVEHAGPREAQDQRRVDHAEHDRRQHQMMQPLGQRHTRIAVARHRKPAEADREHLPQDEAEPEARYSGNRHGDPREDLIGEPASPHGGDDAAGHADGGRDENR